MEAMEEAVPYARTCCQGQLQDDELTSLCYETLVKCAKRYDPKRGRFFAFCKPRIRGALLRYWNTQGVTVRNAVTVPLEIKDGEDEETPAVGVADPDFDRINFREQWQQVSAIMVKTLSDRECAILQLVYCLNFTFEQAGARFDVSRAAAQAIAAKAIQKIKSKLPK